MLLYCIKNNIYDMLLFNAFELPPMVTVYRYNSLHLCSICHLCFSDFEADMILNAYIYVSGVLPLESTNRHQ